MSINGSYHSYFIEIDQKQYPYKTNLLIQTLVLIVICALIQFLLHIFENFDRGGSIFFEEGGIVLSMKLDDKQGR